MDNNTNNEETVENINADDLSAEFSPTCETEAASPDVAEESAKSDAGAASPDVAEESAKSDSGAATLTEADSPVDKKNFWTFPNIMRLLAAAAAVIVIIFTLLGRMSDELGTRMLEFGLICFAIAFFSRKKE